MKKEPVHALLLPGDLSYADCTQYRWDTWENMITHVAAEVPLMVAPGNHDVETIMCDHLLTATYPNPPTPLTSYCSRHRMPGSYFFFFFSSNYLFSFTAGIPYKYLYYQSYPAITFSWNTLFLFLLLLQIPGTCGWVVEEEEEEEESARESQGESGAKETATATADDMTRTSGHQEEEEDVLWYSFNVGTIHVLSLCSYCNYDLGSKQSEFIINDLAAVMREVTPFVVVMLHVPLYHTNHKHQDETQSYVDQWENLFVVGGVDVVVAGHVHAYERTTRIVGGVFNADGPIHITIGDGGNREGLANQWLEDVEKISEFRNGVAYGYGKLRANVTHLVWQWYASLEDDNNEREEEEGVEGEQQVAAVVGDSVVLARRRHGRRVEGGESAAVMLPAAGVVVGRSSTLRQQ